MQDEKKSPPLTQENPAAAFKGTKSGIGRLFNALHYSLDGIKAAIEEAGFREPLMLHTVLLIGHIACHRTAQHCAGSSG